MTNRFVGLCALSLAFLPALQARAGFMDLSSVTPGNGVLPGPASGLFTGTLDGIAVTGAITTAANYFQFNADGDDHNYEFSTVNNTSPQYSYSNIYSPSTPLTDRVGYTSFGSTLNNATITIDFSSPITNPIFQIANLDGMHYDFADTPSLGSLVLLSGNGGVDTDGLVLTGSVSADGNLTTIEGQDPNQSPLVNGTARSGYGSVEIVGSYSQLVINVSNPDKGGDGGSFTLATASTPLPTAAVGGGVLIFVLGAYGLLKRRQTLA